MMKVRISACADAAVKVAAAMKARANRLRMGDLLINRRLSENAEEPVKRPLTARPRRCGSLNSIDRRERQSVSAGTRSFVGPVCPGGNVGGPRGGARGLTESAK